MSYHAGALVEPMSVALHAVSRAAVPLGSRVAVIGGGAVGLCILQALLTTGARDVQPRPRGLPAGNPRSDGWRISCLATGFYRIGTNRRLPTCN